MRPGLATHVLFALGFALLAAVNVLVLHRVEENRKGTPNALLWLTERELSVVDRLEFENNGMSVRLNWRSLGSGDSETGERTPAWLTSEKLLGLGFRLNVAPSNGRRWQREARPVFLVLEYNGSSYLEAVRRAEQALEKEEAAVRVNPGDKSQQAIRQQARKRVRAEEMTQSRLFAVDAGTDPRQLRSRYNDTARYIITPGVIRFLITKEDNRENGIGMIDSIAVETIHVPLEHRQVIETLVQRGKFSKVDDKPPRYNVQLAFGSHLEPWIVAVRQPGEEAK